jgi:hypothetical protein
MIKSNLFFRLLLSLSCLIVLNSTALAQDKLVLQNDSIIDCTILKLGKNRISYIIDGKYVHASDHKSIKLKHIKHTVIDYKSNAREDSTSYSNWVKSRRSAIKFNLVSPLVNTVSLSFEHTRVIRRSMEYETGFIGLFNVEDPIPSRGLFLSVGYKFFYDSQYYPFRVRKPHPLKGPYFKPKLIFAGYEVDRGQTTISTSGTTTSIETDRILSGSLIAELGRQFIFKNSMSIDFSFGIGLGHTTIKNVDPGNIQGRARNFHFGYMADKTGWSRTYSARIAFGLLSYL